MILLLLVIAFIIAILCIPIIYSLKVSSRKPYEFDFRLEWMYRILKVHIAYKQGHSLFKEVYVLGSMKVGSARDYEDWLNRRVKEELDPLAGEAEQDDVDSKEAQKEPDPYPVSGYSGPEPVESVRFDKNGNVLHPVESTSQKGTTEEPKETKELPKFWWWKHVSNPKLYEALFTVSKQCAGHASPRVFRLEGDFGIPRPYEMGLITATAYTLCPKQVEQVNFSYTEFAYTGSLEVKGHMQLGVFAFYGTLFVVKKAVRECLIDSMKAFLQYRRRKQSAK